MPIDPRNIEVIDDATAEMFRGKTGPERMQIVDAMFRFCRDLIRGGVVAQHPDWSPEQIDREVARRVSHGAF